MTKDKLIPIWSEAIISELLVFKILNIFPKKLLGEDFISKFNLSLECKQSLDHRKNQKIKDMLLSVKFGIGILTST